MLLLTTFTGTLKNTHYCILGLIKYGSSSKGHFHPVYLIPCDYLLAIVDIKYHCYCVILFSISFYVCSLSFSQGFLVVNKFYLETK